MGSGDPFFNLPSLALINFLRNSRRGLVYTETKYYPVLIILLLFGLISQYWISQEDIQLGLFVAEINIHFHSWQLSVEKLIIVLQIDSLRI